ncbi:hypothetical protein OEA41_007783 [Lepraria neglecta]|uniref:Uncharacterized protein n=1 Tax=Lepraria neglecta TaxID=209136 RepID=A0AAE0DQN8_9LECA|nr:hypothetical protein OEA41_007783 [Lepraria neglecta]
MSAAASLMNITFRQLDFTANCSNLALGIQVWNNFLYYDEGNYYYALNGTATTDSEAVDDGPGGPDGDFPDFWTNGTAPDWIAFWRATLGAKIPDTYLSLTDNDVLVAYCIEASILALSLIFYGLKLFKEHVAGRPSSKGCGLSDPHDAAVVASSASFLDTSSYFSLSISFAAIIFNYKNSPLLYEDKLGQISTLLTIDAPVAIALLSYPWLERRDLRVFLAAIATLMTFIIQFMFRRAKKFNPTTNICFNWNSVVEGFFQDRFIVKAVWASLVFPFFVWKVVPWHIFRRTHPSTNTKPRKPFRIPQQLRIWQRLPLWERFVNSSAILTLCAKSWACTKNIRWEILIAYTLAAYALYDSLYDIRFLIFLRKQESFISSTKDTAEEQWGYGQILAVCVWVPVIVEYFYALGWKLGWWGKKAEVAEKEWICDADNVDAETEYEMVIPEGR